MPSSRAGYLWVIPAWILALLSTGCVSSSSAPDDFLAPVEETGRHPFGGWIEITRSGSDSLVVGELLAVHEDSVFVLGPGAEPDLTAVARADISDAEMFAYDARFGRLAGWTAAGTLGTISHGLFLIFTGPIWIITGTSAASIQSRQPRLRRSDDDSWNAFRLYSRYPAGLPPAARQPGFVRAERGE